MLEVGKSYKVKVEVELGKFGYGRAMVLDKSDDRLLIQLRTSKDPNLILPKGTKLWFVSDSPTATLNGLWYTTVNARKVEGSSNLLECDPVKFEQLVQKRKSFRVPFTCPVKVEGKTIQYEIKSRDISRSGIAIEASTKSTENFPIGDNVTIILHTLLGDVSIKCNVVRSEYNWLTNKTIVGLKFIDLTQDAVDALEQLRAVAGQTAGEESQEQYGQLGSTWADMLAKNKEDTKLGSKFINTPESEDQDQ